MIWDDIKAWAFLVWFALLLLFAAVGLVHYSGEMAKCHRHGGAYVREAFGYKRILAKK